MCGVPIERADEYLHRLIALGHRVAVCEQLEDPAEARKRGGKSIVRRDVVRLVTPGTLTEICCSMRGATTTSSPSPAQNRPRTARAGSRSPSSTFRPANSASPNATALGLPAELARLEPGEMIVSDALYGDAEVAPLLRTLPGDAARPRRVRRRDRGAPARRLFRGRHHRCVRRALAARADRGRRLHHLCGAHPDRQAPAALAADARGAQARRSRSTPRRAPISN